MGGSIRSVGLEDSLLNEVDQGAEGRHRFRRRLIIVVCGDSAIGLEATLPSSVFLATQNLLLSATALGLGSAMTTLATRFSDELRQLLDLPGVGSPDGCGAHRLARPPPRSAPPSAGGTDGTHRDRYGVPW